jgi:hypothetical protein
LLTLFLDIYAIIDLYGRCVQLAIYDEDYISRTSTAEVTSTETQTAATANDEKDQCKDFKIILLKANTSNKLTDLNNQIFFKFKL